MYRLKLNLLLEKRVVKKELNLLRPLVLSLIFAMTIEHFGNGLVLVLENSLA